jgi:mannosyltransferase OCH1-like enzyme
MPSRIQLWAVHINAKVQRSLVCRLLALHCTLFTIILLLCYHRNKLTWTMAPRYIRFIKSLPLFMVALFFLAKIRSRITYERSLNAAAITLDDFPPDYTQALIAAQRQDKQPEYHWSKLTDPGPAAQKTIPPIIHFIWLPNLYHNHLDISKIPIVGSDAAELCRKHNPDYQINIWNASAARALLEEHYGWFLPRYDAYQYPIQRVDAFKYFVLWHHGGVYMDLDISCRRALDPLLQFAA